MSDSLNVNLGDRSYTLDFGASLNASVNEFVARLRSEGRRVVVIADRRVLEVQRAAIKEMFGDAPTFAVEPGEQSKSMGMLGRVLDFLAEQRLDRAGMVFAVGGGVVGDLAGFAAAAYLRGVDFVQIPTTLLAMVDSSVGGKTGINLSAGKNLVGAFHQPKKVFIATGLLETLPPREFAAGMAEVVKYGLLADTALFELLEKAPLTVGSSHLAAVIKKCCAIKAKIVEADERELAKDGGRALLNLGHTFGHAIEQVTHYTEYLHGEAVAVGIVAAAVLSQSLGLLDAPAVHRVTQVLQGHALPTRLRRPLPLNLLMDALARDKKVRAGLPRFIVLEKIGSAVTRAGIEPSLIENAFREVGAVS